jgi:hypothetical protein
MIKKEIMMNKIKQVTILVVIFLIYKNIETHAIEIPTCDTDSKECISKKQSVTTSIMTKQISMTIIIGFGIWHSFSMIGVNPSALLTSAGISVAIIGLALKPILDEYIQGSVLIFQKRVKLADNVYILTRWGRWFPDKEQGPVKVVDLTPSFFTFQYQDGSKFTMNTTQINGFRIFHTDEVTDKKDDSAKPLVIHNEDSNVEKDDMELLMEPEPDPFLQFFM